MTVFNQIINQSRKNIEINPAVGSWIQCAEIWPEIPALGQVADLARRLDANSTGWPTTKLGQMPFFGSSYFRQFNPTADYADNTDADVYG